MGKFSPEEREAWKRSVCAGLIHCWSVPIQIPGAGTPDLAIADLNFQFLIFSFQFHDHAALEPLGASGSSCKLPIPMLAFLFSLFLGVGIPWGILRDKDQRAGRIVTLNRPQYVCWLLGVVALSLFGGYVGAMLIAAGSVPGTQYGLALALSYLATRRLRDIDLSPRLAILGLAPSLATWGSLVLCFVPTAKPSKRDWE